MQNISKILNKTLKDIKVSPEQEGYLNIQAKILVKELEKIIKQKKIKAGVFIGGSLVKKTLIKKKKQDIDVFIRFGKKYSEAELAEKFRQIIEKLNAGKLKVHGSRDYYRIKIKNAVFEIVPTLNISSPEKARNTTDLSYFHVSYVLKKLKQYAKLADEIILAKTFAYSSGCYGAESHIKGFSGYAIELLVIYYKSFLNFIRKIVKTNEKIIIDPAKFYKNKQDILLNLNEAKLESPVVLIDPTFRQRNATSGLSKETFVKFQEYCRDFLKKPSQSFFCPKEISEIQMKKTAKIKNAEYVKLTAGTSRQEGSVAGSKLLKFFNIIESQLAKYYEILKKEFVYNDKKQADYYFIIKPRKSIIIKGPPITSLENVAKFRKKHKNAYIKNKRAYAKLKIIPIKKIMQEIKRNRKLMKDMGIISFS